MSVAYHTATVRGMAFSGDGLTFASASDDQTVRIWCIRSKPLRPASVGSQKGISKLQFSADSKALFAADGSGKAQPVWPQPQPAKEAPAQSPVAGAIKAAVTQGVLQLLDASNGKPLGRGLASGMVATAISPDGKLLAANGQNGAIWMWDLDPQVWISLACHQANRNLSLTQWKIFLGADVPYRRTCPNLPDGDGVAKK